MAAQGRRRQGRRAPPALRHDVVPGGCRAGDRTPLEGAAVLFRGGRRGGGTRVGGTVSSNDTGLPAQHPHNAGDGDTVGLVE
jgi:hypothetical protein